MLNLNKLLKNGYIKKKILGVKGKSGDSLVYVNKSKEKLDFDLYLSVELSDMIYANSDEVKIKFPIEDQCR